MLIKEFVLLFCFPFLLLSCATHAPSPDAFMDAFEKETVRIVKVKEDLVLMDTIDTDANSTVMYINVRYGDYDSYMGGSPSYWDGGVIAPLFVDFLVFGISIQWSPIAILGVGNRYFALRGWMDLASILSSNSLGEYNVGFGFIQQIILNDNFRFGMEENYSRNSYQNNGAVFGGGGRSLYTDVGIGVFARYKFKGEYATRSFSLGLRVQKRYEDEDVFSEYGKYLVTLSVGCSMWN